VINSNIYPISHRFRDTTTYSLEVSLKIAAKQLQMEDMVTIDSL